MKIYRENLKLETREKNQFFDITDNVNKVIRDSGIKEGMVLVQSSHTTTGVIIIEAEPNALEDIVDYLNEKAPFDAGYRHDDPSLRKDCPEDEPKNCDAHIKSSCYSQSSVAWSVSQGKLELGRYQRLLFQEFDGPCPRKHKSMRQYLVKVMGE